MGILHFVFKYNEIIPRSQGCSGHTGYRELFSIRSEGFWAIDIRSARMERYVVTVDHHRYEYLTT